MRIGGQPIVDRYMSGPAHNYPGSFSEVWDNSSIASLYNNFIVKIMPVINGCDTCYDHKLIDIADILYGLDQGIGHPR